MSRRSQCGNARRTISQSFVALERVSRSLLPSNIKKGGFEKSDNSTRRSGKHSSRRSFTLAQNLSSCVDLAVHSPTSRVRGEKLYRFVSSRWKASPSSAAPRMETSFSKQRTVRHRRRIPLSFIKKESQAVGLFHFTDSSTGIGKDRFENSQPPAFAEAARLIMAIDFAGGAACQKAAWPSVCSGQRECHWHRTAPGRRLS